MSALAIKNILHPSDFSTASLVAFAHALKIALVTQGSLALLHVAPDAEQMDWDKFPGVRDTLERWGLLARGSTRADVPKLGIDVSKVMKVGSDPVDAVLAYLGERPTDLIVLAHEQRPGLAGWLRKSVSEPVARLGGEMTLFVAAGQRGFVSVDDGGVTLSRILIPIAHDPRPQPALHSAARFIRQLDRPEGIVRTLHVGDGEPPEVLQPTTPGWTWESSTRSGNVIDAIIAEATEMQAQLIIMTTNGRDGFLDALRGSHSERVVNLAPCPLLVIPESSSVA